MEIKRGKVGRKPLPPEKRKVRIQIYATPKVAEKIKEYAERIIEESERE